MTTSKCTLAALLLILSACSPGCTGPAAGPESGPPSGGGGAPTADADAKDPNGQAPVFERKDDIQEAPGVDLTRLTDPQRTSFFSLINSEASACQKPHSLAVSLRDDAACKDSRNVAQFIADVLATGASVSDIKANIEPLVDSLQPKKIDVEGRPVYGNDNAPVTVVVFADFECPHCKQEAPVLRAAIDQFRGRARLVYKHFPLNGHVRARAAAVASVAAHEQGKFWPMHDLIFENQTTLEDADIKRFAQRIGLDMAKFEAHWKAKKGEALVEADRAEGEKLDISGTPAVFVNGRQFNPMMFGGTVTGWIDDALKR
ncbi:MAG: thioredoxin domain-containing protein [Myxococcales bacterium]|nr:thioredoxin domain-containing protein [Myxococcales bacterium]